MEIATKVHSFMTKCTGLVPIHGRMGMSIEERSTKANDMERYVQYSKRVSRCWLALLKLFPFLFLSAIRESSSLPMETCTRATL